MNKGKGGVVEGKEGVVEEGKGGVVVEEGREV